jgi:hypothetical protein
MCDFATDFVKLGYIFCVGKVISNNIDRIVNYVVKAKNLIAE